MKKDIYQFKIELCHVRPKVWRLIQVPSDYTFWDLHVAIQDSMGWFDYHLHEYTIKTKGRRSPIRIGMPDEDTGDSVMAGWDVPITKYFMHTGDSCLYEYDFGDDWEHTISLTEIVKSDGRRKYPYCVDGSGSCPPEDVGGPGGYGELLLILNDKSDNRYKEMVFWLKNHVKNYYPIKPEYFNPKAVKFDDPKERLELLFDD